MYSVFYDDLDIKKCNSREIDIFSYHDYLFDVVYNLDEDIYEYWLYHKSCGIKSFVFGIPGDDISYRHFIDCILSNIDEDIKFYDEKYNF